VPDLIRDDVALHYEVFGEGYPLLLLAPGGMRSEIGYWQRQPFNPVAEFSAAFRVIAMDQRNAGLSRAGVRATDGWHTYAADQVALLDHLGVERCHIMGGCIGSSYCLGLIQAAPDRITAAVLQNPIGLSNGNRAEFYAMFDEWAAELQQAGRAGSDELAGLRENMFGGDFVFCVTRDFVRALSTPLLVLAGADVFHPTETAREIAALAQRAELMLEWGTATAVPQTVARVRSFFQSQTPVAAAKA
jgi:pimeloyl-ACP methyl ester carboxylesterase